MPLIDAIDGNKYTFTEQAGGDGDGLARGAWDWSFQWKRIPLTKKEKAHRIHVTEPYRYYYEIFDFFNFSRKLYAQKFSVVILAGRCCQISIQNMLGSRSLHF